MTIVCKQMRMHNICPGIYLPYKWWYHYNYAFAKPRVSKPICKYTYILKQNKVLNCIIHIQWQNTLIDGSAENVLFYILAGWICRHCGSWICRRYCRGQHNAHSRTLSHIHSYLVWKMVVIQESWKADILLFCLIRMNELFRFFYNTNVTCLQKKLCFIYFLMLHSMYTISIVLKKYRPSVYWKGGVMVYSRVWSKIMLFFSKLIVYLLTYFGYICTIVAVRLWVIKIHQIFKCIHSCQVNYVLISNICLVTAAKPV